MFGGGAGCKSGGCQAVSSHLNAAAANYVKYKSGTDLGSHLSHSSCISAPYSTVCVVFWCRENHLCGHSNPLKHPCLFYPLQRCACVWAFYDTTSMPFIFDFIFYFLNLWRAVLVLLQPFCAVLGSDLYVFYRITCGELESPCSDYHNCVWSPLEACHLCIDLFLLVQIGNCGWRYWIIGHRS